MRATRNNDPRLAWLQRAAFWLIFGLFLVAFVRTAWVSEDAFITFRTIENLSNGHGAVWNVGERVQAYTHPMWMGLLFLVNLAIGDLYYVAIALSLILTAATLLFLYFRVADQHWSALVVLFSLLLSKAFIDYSSSGLENPLLYLLLALSAWCYFRHLQLQERPLAFFFLCSLVFLTRPDAIVLLLPALAHVALLKFRAEGVSALTNLARLLAAGFAPVAIWLAFSMFYYGSPVPNTALAKVGTDLPFADRASQALAYIFWSWEHDRWTLLLIAVAIIVGMAGRKRAMNAMLSSGLTLWFVYLFYVGADYMAGRFFSFPMILAAFVVIYELKHSERTWAFLLMLLVALGLGSLAHSVASPVPFQVRQVSLSTGIADERSVYHEHLGLLPTWQTGSWKTHPWLQLGFRFKGHDGPFVRCAVGMTPFASGGNPHWVDPLALTEPFLARLPSRSNVRVGHYERVFPAGYLESVAAGQNLIVDPILAALYEDVQLVTRGSLLTRGRMSAIWRLNFGHRIDWEHVQFDPDGPGPFPELYSDEGLFTCLGIRAGWERIWSIEEGSGELIQVWP